MKNLKVFLTTLLIVTLFMGVSNVVFATETNEFTFQPIVDSGPFATTVTATPTPTSPTNLTPTTTTSTPTPVRVTPTPTPTPAPTATSTNNTSVYNNSNLPKAGSTDSFTVIAIIAVFGVSALYAYKKIKDYNIK